MYYPDGTTVVEHADGTRITSRSQELDMPPNEAEAPDEKGGKRVTIVPLFYNPLF